MLTLDLSSNTGAKFHVTPNLEWFSNYVDETCRTVRLSNREECKIVGIGEFPIQLPNGNTITMHQVRYVPTLKRSLVSIGMLAEDGYKTTLKESTWIATQVQQLVPTDGDQFRRGRDHISQARLDRLMAVGYIPKLQAKMDFCEHCRYGK